MDGNSFGPLIGPSSFVLVLMGSIGAVLAGFRMNDAKRLPKGIGETELVWNHVGYADDTPEMRERRYRVAKPVLVESERVQRYKVLKPVTETRFGSPLKVVITSSSTASTAAASWLYAPSVMCMDTLSDSSESTSRPDPERRADDVAGPVDRDELGLANGGP